MLTELQVEDLSPAAFAAYGQVIAPTPDGQPYGLADAQLDLSQGIPRFYIMHLEHRGLAFSLITRHERCTQCLGSLAVNQPWYLAVAPPSVQPEPEPQSLRAFRITGPCFIKLHIGTWHAGPFFEAATMDFYNLELSDTNVVDHTTYDFQKPAQQPAQQPAQHQAQRFEFVL